MAEYSRSEISSRRVEFRVPSERPWGACWVEVMKAIHAATAELRELGSVKQGEQPADDQIRMFSGDDEIIVFYVVEKSDSTYAEWRTA